MNRKKLSNKNYLYLVKEPVIWLLKKFQYIYPVYISALLNKIHISANQTVFEKVEMPSKDERYQLKKFEKIIAGAVHRMTRAENN